MKMMMKAIIFHVKESFAVIIIVIIQSSGVEKSRVNIIFKAWPVVLSAVLLSWQLFPLNETSKQRERSAHTSQLALYKF